MVLDHKSRPKLKNATKATYFILGCYINPNWPEAGVGKVWWKKNLSKGDGKKMHVLHTRGDWGSNPRPTEC